MRAKALVLVALIVGSVTCVVSSVSEVFLFSTKVEAAPRCDGGCD